MLRPLRLLHKGDVKSTIEQFARNFDILKKKGRDNLLYAQKVNYLRPLLEVELSNTKF